MAGWIKPKDELPRNGQRILVCLKHGKDRVSQRTFDKRYYDLCIEQKGFWHSNYAEITHWMEMPEPPKEVE